MYTVQIHTKKRGETFFLKISVNKMNKRNLGVLAIIFSVIIILISLTMDWGTGFPMMGGWMMGGGGWMGVGMVLFWVLIVIGTYLLIRGFVTSGRGERDRAVAIAKERYARGEITLEEFEEIKKHLF